jgi:endonuclease/exonuclease/phosphatase family metal-dependent hydrolase
VVCSVRVMSFNVRGASHARDGVNLWEKRAAMNVETIRRYGPDVIGFQECQNENLEAYEKELPGYARLPGPVYGTGQVEEFAAIFFDPERFEELDSGGFWLSDTPEEYSASWGNEVIRSANWAVLRCRENGASFLHLNTHLYHVSEPARVEGNRLIVKQTKETRANHDDPPTIVTGDFNCKPETPPYRVFMEEDFVDTFLAGGNPDDLRAFTFHAFKGARFHTGRHGQAGRAHRLDPSPRRSRGRKHTLARDPARWRRRDGEIPERPLPRPRRTRTKRLVSDLFRHPRINTDKRIRDPRLMPSGKAGDG